MLSKEVENMKQYYEDGEIVLKSTLHHISAIQTLQNTIQKQAEEIQSLRQSYQAAVEQLRAQQRLSTQTNSKF